MGGGEGQHAREKREETFGTINVCRICLIDDSHAITHGERKSGGRQKEREQHMPYVVRQEEGEEGRQSETGIECLSP